MKAAQVLSQFQAAGLETCFHGRHIDPQIYAGLDGSNWALTPTFSAAATRQCAPCWVLMALLP